MTRMAVVRVVVAWQAKSRALATMAEALEDTPGVRVVAEVEKR